MIGDGHGSLQQGRRHKKPRLDDDIKPLALKESEIDDLVAFLASLTSADYEELGDKELARQRALSRTSRPQRDMARPFGPKRPNPNRRLYLS